MMQVSLGQSVTRIKEWRWRFCELCLRYNTWDMHFSSDGWMESWCHSLIHMPPHLDCVMKSESRQTYRQSCRGGGMQTYKIHKRTASPGPRGSIFSPLLSSLHQEEGGFSAAVQARAERTARDSGGGTQRKEASLSGGAYLQRISWFLWYRFMKYVLLKTWCDWSMKGEHEYCVSAARTVWNQRGRNVNEDSSLVTRREILFAFCAAPTPPTIRWGGLNDGSEMLTPMGF